MAKFKEENYNSSPKTKAATIEIPNSSSHELFKIQKFDVDTCLAQNEYNTHLEGKSLVLFVFVI
jgi:hypothetical protein